MSDPNYPMGLEIIKQEYRKIIDILGQDVMTWDIKQLMMIYVPRTLELKNQKCRPEDQMTPGSLTERRHQDTSCPEKSQHD